MKDTISLRRIINFPARGIGAKTIDKCVEQAKKDKIEFIDVLKNPNNMEIRGKQADALFKFYNIIIKYHDLRKKLSASELQDMGVLSNCHVNVVQLKETAVYNNYQSELTYLTTDKERMKYLSSFIQTVAETGNTLVLVDRIKAGEIIAENIPDVTFVKGAMKVTDRKDAYDEINEATNSITVATYGVAAVGINIPRIFNLILLEPGKSFVRVIQSIGRGVRKAEDKDFVQIWDVTSTAKFSKKHLTERKKFYKEANYPFTIEKTDWR